VERPIRAFEDELDGIFVVQPAKPDGLGEPSTKHVKPVDNITLAHIVISDENQSFVLGAFLPVSAVAKPFCF